MKKRIIIIAISAVVLIGAIFGVAALLSNDSVDRPLTVAQLLDLGEKYLLESNYEQALVQFHRVIEIEPMNPRGYTRAAEAYIGLGQLDRAEQILHQGFDMTGDAEIQRMLDVFQSDPPTQDQPEETPEATPEVTPPLDPVPTPDSQAVAPSMNMLADMSREERIALHTFFSNFSEAWLLEFNSDNYDINGLVDFALRHNYRNYFDRFSFGENGFFMLASSYVEQTISRYFGISGINHAAYTSDWHYYRDGVYYMMGANGDPLAWSQVTHFADNGDGTFTAHIDVFESHVPPVNLYEDISDWRLDGAALITKNDPNPEHADVWEAVVYIYSSIAIVAPHEHNGRQTYKLLMLFEDRG